MSALGSRVFYTDERPSVDVRASLTLLPETLHGRRSDPQVRCRPSHNFGPPEGREFFVGQVEFDSATTIEPGQTREVLVRFIDGPGLQEQLRPGRSWRVQEGLTLVATASVIEVVRET